MIEINVHPEIPGVSWEYFVNFAPMYSIALDGYVIDSPKYNHSRILANMNHHAGVDRLATRATCAQVLMAIRQGLFRTFRKNNYPYAKVYVNDCDEDVCLSVFLLNNHSLCEQTISPILNRLVTLEDTLDATAGAYPFPSDLPALRELAWVFEPYRQFRMSGQLDKKNSRAYLGVVEDVGGRISRHITGHGQEISLDTTYNRIGGGNGWVMVKEIGAQARTGMLSDGIRAYVSVRELAKGRWAYIMGRLSGFIPFDLPKIYEVCNAAEIGGIAGDTWGGSDTIGGSPRVGGSRISPEELTKLIDSIQS